MRHGVRRIAAVVGLALLLGAGPVTTATTSRPAGEPKRLTFVESNPLSDLREWVRREGGTVAMLRRAGAVYDVKEESFEVYVPAGCRDGNKHGLLVWIPPGKAEVPAEWFDVFDRAKLIWVSPNNAGNSRNALVRVALAMDAVYNLEKQYPVDAGRVYVAGFSGGGRAASIAAVGFPDVFAGGVCMMGCNFYRVVPAGEGRVYPVGSFRPPGKLLDQVKGHPLVLMTSEGDMNREQTKAYDGAFRREGFKHVTLVEVPGIGHEMPGAEWVERAIAELDRTPMTVAVATTRPSTRPMTTGPVVRPVTGRGSSAATETRTEAERLLAKGKLYRDNGMTERGREMLRRVVDEYPRSDAAKEARKLLDGESKR
jgi:hypothetical protein